MHARTAIMTYSERLVFFLKSLHSRAYGEVRAFFVFHFLNSVFLFPWAGNPTRKTPAVLITRISYIAYTYGHSPG